MDMNLYTQNLLVCNSGQHTYVTGLFNFSFVLQDLIDRINSYVQRNLLLIGFLHHKFFLMWINSLHWMVLCKLERRNYGRKWPVSVKYQNLHSFKVDSLMSEYPWNEKNNTFTWLSSFYNPSKGEQKKFSKT